MTDLQKALQRTARKLTAEYQLRAIECHDDLVQALEAMLNQFDYPADAHVTREIAEIVDGLEKFETLEKARAALQKAKGEK